MNAAAADRLGPAAARRRLLRAAIGVPLAAATAAWAQRPPDTVMGEADHRLVVTQIGRALERYFVDLEGAQRAKARLEAALAAGEFRATTSSFALIDQIDRMLLEATGDRHLALAYSAEARPLSGIDFPAETEADRIADQAAAARRQFGFEKLSRLPGNIALLELNSFQHPQWAGDAAGRVMGQLADSDALIIDLRTSRGGNADMVPFLASFFFDIEPVHLGDWFVRAEGRHQQVWSAAYLPGPRYLGRDVFILVSRRSFSAVEGFTRLMQHHGRARVVGERTRGGTHPGRMVRVHPNFALFVPTAWFVYPIGTPTVPIDRPVYPSGLADRRGDPVQPDIEVTAAQALARAQIEALTRLLARQPARAAVLAARVEELRAEITALAAASR